MSIADKIQLGILFIQSITTVILVCTLLGIWYQLRATHKSLRTNIQMNRNVLFSDTSFITEKEVKDMMMHAFEHFDKANYEKFYKTFPERIKSYLLMKRKYIYLEAVIASDEVNSDQESIGPEIWLKELCQYKEFRDVHASQGHYYPDLKIKVDKIIKTIPDVDYSFADVSRASEKLEDRKWATDFFSEKL